MSRNSFIEQLKKEKETAQKLTILHWIVFTAMFLYVICYEVSWVKISSVTLKIINVVAQSIVAGYILDLLVETLPKQAQKRSMRPIVEYQKNEMAKHLDDLMKALLKDSKWKEKDNAALKRDYDSVASSRRIWTETCAELFEDDNGCISCMPMTLYVIDLFIRRIIDKIDTLIGMSSYIDLDYMEEICWLTESELFKRLHICIGQHESAGLASKNGNTYLDSFFNEELSIRLFVADKTNRIFVDEVRKLIDED